MVGKYPNSQIKDQQHNDTIVEKIIYFVRFLKQPWEPPFPPPPQYPISNHIIDLQQMKRCTSNWILVSKNIEMMAYL